MRPVVTVLIEGDDGTLSKHQREFGGFKRNMKAIAAWLQELGVEFVVMESPGIYWKSAHAHIERVGIPALVVNAHFIKYVPGRKTDRGDSEWLAVLARFGLVRGSFIPPKDLRELRILSRYRRKVSQMLASETNRSFPCRWLPAVLIARHHIHFCIRCDLSRGFKVVREFLLSGESERVVTLRAPNRRDAEDYDCPWTSTTVRLVRVVTPNGRIPVVMTSLLDAIAFPTAAFAGLYHSRWRIEEAFKRIKHRLGLEHTSGLSWHAANQDFGAKVSFDNLNALAA